MNRSRYCSRVTAGQVLSTAVSLSGTGRTALGIAELAEIGEGGTVLIESAAGTAWSR